MPTYCGFVELDGVVSGLVLVAAHHESALAKCWSRGSYSLA